MLTLLKATFGIPTHLQWYINSTDSESDMQINIIRRKETLYPKISTDWILHAKKKTESHCHKKIKEDELNHRQNVDDIPTGEDEKLPLAQCHPLILFC